MAPGGLTVCLIHPRVPARSAFEELGRSSLPPLGLLYLASALIRAGHRVQVLDLNLDHDPEAALRRVEQLRPQLVGLSTLAPAFYGVAALARELRRRLPAETTLVAGGADVTTRAGRYQDLQLFDALLLGEAEQTLPALCASWPEIRPARGVLPAGAEVTLALPPPVVPDEAPLPARHLLPLHRYRGGPAYKRQRLSTSVFTHRGCPYNCAFCEKGVHAGPMRFRSAGSILEEVRQVRRDHGIADIRFIDDVFLYDAEILDEFLELVLRSGERFRWMCTARVDLMDEAVLRKMHRAGCYRLEIGVESGSERVLRMVSKRITLADARAAIALTRRVGIESIANFILGFPTETEAEIQQTIAFALELDPDWAIFFDYYPLEGSRIARKYDLHWKPETDEYNRPEAIFSVSLAQLDQLVHEAYRRFYLNPRQVARKLTRVGSPWVLLDLARMAAAFGLQNLR